MRHATHPLRSAFQATASLLLLFALVGASATATAQSISLPITFEESIDYALRDFEDAPAGPTSTIITDPTDATNMVVQTVRPATAVCYAGTTVAEGVGFDEAIPFTADATTMSVRVWSPEAGALVLLKVEEQGNGALFVETYSYTTVAGGWETMVFDFADPKPNGAPIQVGGNYNKATIFFDFQCDNVPPTTLPAADRTYYWDDVAFGGDPGGGGGSTSEALILTGVIDGPLTGGVPKGVELYVAEDIADLSLYGLGSANNADGTNGVEFAFPMGSASAGDFLYVASEETGFTDFFGFAPDYTSGAANINGDDSIELFYDPNGVVEAAPESVPATTAVVDVFGEVGVDGTGQPWEHLDGWAYRVNATGPDGSTFALDNWSFSGVDALDGETTNATAATPFPVGTYSTMTGGGGGGSAIALPVTFEEMIDYELRDFNGTTTTVVEDPTDATNTVAQTVRAPDAATFAGTVLADVSGFTSRIPFADGATTMSLRVWSPTADTPVRLKVENKDDGGINVEKEVRTTTAGMWETLVFDFSSPEGAALNTSADYNKAVVFFDFGTASTPEAVTYYWDDLAFGGDAGGGGGGSAIALPLTFEESIDYEFQDFDGTTTTLVADPTDATNTVAQTDRAAAAACFAGTTVANTTGFDAAIPFTADATTMSVRVWSPEAGVLVLFKVEDKDNAALFVETYTYTTVAAGWETMVFDFADPRPNGAPIQVGGNYNKATIFFDFQCDNVPPTTLPAADRTYYWDDVAFGGDPGPGDPEVFAGYLLGANEVPAVETSAGGFVSGSLSGNDLTLTGSFAGLTGDYLFSHLHLAPAGGNGDVFATLDPTIGADSRSGTFDETVTLDDAQVNALRAGEVYVNVHSETFNGGELRAQLIVDPATPAVTIQQARNIGAGNTVTVTGTVSRAAGELAFLQDDSMAGISVRQVAGAFFDEVAAGTIDDGTSLTITGELSEFASLLQFNEEDLTSYTNNGAADAVTPQQVTFAEFAANGEAYESELLLVRGLTFADAGGTFEARTTYGASDDSGDGNVRTGNADNTEVDGLAIPPANSNVTGVGGQFSFDDPAVGYQLLPINATDIQVATANEDGLAEAGARLVVQNPARGTVSVRFDVGTPGAATLAVYDAIGRQVAVLAEGDLQAGEQTVTLDAVTLASGVYVVRLSLADGALTRVVTVVR